MRLAAAFGLMILVGSAAAEEPAPAVEPKLLERALEHRHRLEFDGQTFSGPAWQLLVEEGGMAQFFLIGEEHGIAENPKLAAALFTALVPSGYARLAIEVSPFMAAEMDRALRRDGMAGLRALFAEPGGTPAFFGMEEEAAMLATVRAAIPGDRPILWGADYEVLSDRRMLQALEGRQMPPSSAAALATLRAASDAAWKRYEETASPRYVFSYSADPELVRAVEAAWPNRDAEAAWILDTLEETLEINRLFVRGENWRSNRRRAELLRSNFLRHWTAATSAGRPPRVMAKFGASHVVRGLSSTDVFDLGALLPELAASGGASAFSVLVLPGAGSLTAVLDPTSFTYRSAPAKDGYGEGLEPLRDAAYADVFTLFDLRPLRPLARSRKGKIDPNLIRVIHGFDTLLVLSGSTPSQGLERGE